LACGVADSSGVVADNQDGLVAEVLKLAHFAQDDRVAEMNVGAGWVKAELDSQLPNSLFSIGELLSQFGVSENLDCAAFQ
jgi:hypothetical protein